MPGAEKCLANLALTKSRFEKLGRQGLLDWCNEVMRESQKKYCPVDTGNLRRSGRVQVLKDSPAEFHVRLSYTANYAIYVHEIPMAHDVGSMKYLSTPFNLMSFRLMKKLESEMAGAV